MTKFEISENLKSVTGVVHGFFTKHGGVSSGALSSLNCSLRVGDIPSNVKENRNRALRALDLEGCRLLIPNLSHSDQVMVVSEEDHPQHVAEQSADALITTANGVALAVTYADCLPIMLASADGLCIAAIHAGWRGIRQDIITKTIEKMQASFGPCEIMAAIGPAISSEGFLVTGDVLESFSAIWPDYVIKNDHGFGVDLVSIAYQQLKDCGVNHIDKVGGLTDLNPEDYFSHRRDRGQTGRHLAVIAKPPRR